MAAQAGLCLTWSKTPKTGFLVTRVNYNVHYHRTSIDIVITLVFSSNFKLKWSIFLTLLNLWLLVGTLWHCCGDCSYYSVTFSWRQGPEVVEIHKNKRHFQHILYIPVNNSWNYFCNCQIYSNKYPLPFFMGKGDHILPKLALGH